MCATSIFILILFLPAALLPLGFDTLFSAADLDEMGVCLESHDDAFLMQEYELVGFLPATKHCDTWEVKEPLQTCL